VEPLTKPKILPGPEIDATSGGMVSRMRQEAAKAARALEIEAKEQERFGARNKAATLSPVNSDRMNFMMMTKIKKSADKLAKKQTVRPSPPVRVVPC
jgi:hypothetical protein